MYPLNELLGGVGVDILDITDSQSEQENGEWNENILSLVGQVVRSN